MFDLEKSLDRVIAAEGGYVNHPADRGGPTKYGITQTTLGKWLGRPATVQEVRDLDEATARSIYRRDYYTGPKIDMLPEQIRDFVFDAAVNHGPRKAVTMLQVVCSAAGLAPGPIDGTVGPKTIAAARAYARLFLDRLIDARERVYRGIVRDNPSQQVFLNGWLERLARYKDEGA